MRYTATIKAQIVSDVLENRKTLEDIRAEHGVSEEEFHSWYAHLMNHGVRGLRTTKIQRYREARHAV